MFDDEASRSWTRIQELVNAGVTVTLSRPGKDRGPVTARLALGGTIVAEREAGTASQALRRVYETWWPLRKW